MSDTVVDSSVAAKWILPESDSPDADRLITDVAQKGERLFEHRRCQRRALSFDRDGPHALLYLWARPDRAYGGD